MGVWWSEGQPAPYVGAVFGEARGLQCLYARWVGFGCKLLCLLHMAWHMKQDCGGSSSLMPYAQAAVYDLHLGGGAFCPST
jgi:hypothetical protein